MKAAILTELNKPLVVADLELPKELKPGQVLVKVLATTICGKQLGEVSGHYGPDKYLPHLLGHEGCGVVEEIGPGVRYVAVGDKVVMHWRKGRGIEAEPPVYRWKNEGYYTIVGAGPVATFAEKTIVSENRLTVIDQATEPAIGSLMGCAITTAFGLINNEAQLKIGQSVLIIGAGGVGLVLVQAAKLVGAGSVVVIDQNSDKVNQAIAIGADKGGVGVWKDFASLFPFDVVIDTTGVPELIDKGLRLTAPGGKLILVGQTKHEQSLCFSNMLSNYCGKTIIDSQGGGTNPNEDIPRYLGMYEQGKLNFDYLIGDSYPLRLINEAMDATKLATGRVLLTT